MKLQNKKGFTLIELLVVITIIGILATGAVATYTSQIQKARDTTRTNDIKALQAGIEQVYQDAGNYPVFTNFGSGVSKYVERFPTDSKTDQACNGGTPCDYLYSVRPDTTGIENQNYNISTGLENT
jgi:prepilin-type N-terminal cleavage/methylation domain-containing protein